MLVKGIASFLQEQVYRPWGQQDARSSLFDDAVKRGIVDKRQSQNIGRCLVRGFHKPSLA